MKVTKPEFMRSLDELPEEATIQDAIDRLYVLYKIEQGIAAADEGRKVTQEEARAHEALVAVRLAALATRY